MNRRLAMRLRGPMLALAGAATLAAPAQAQRVEAYVCAKPGEERRVELTYRGAQSVPCEVWYSAGGTRQRLAWATGTVGHCERKLKEVLENLKKSQFECARRDQTTAATPAPPPAPAEPRPPVASRPPQAAAAPAPAAAESAARSRLAMRFQVEAIEGLRQCLDSLSGPGRTCKSGRYDYRVAERARTSLTPEEGDVEVDIVHVLHDSGRGDEGTGGVFLVSREAQPRGLPLKDVLPFFRWARSIDLNGDGRLELVVASASRDAAVPATIAVHVFGGGAPLAEIATGNAPLGQAALYALSSRHNGYADLLAVAGDVVYTCAFGQKYDCTPSHRLDPALSGAPR